MSKPFEYGLEHEVQIWWETAVDSFLKDFERAVELHDVTYSDVVNALLERGHADMADELIDFLSIGE